ncbi:hypothetical protein SUGI_0058820 [Cryptomeria japonica]|nr:hypothetical protein SUGI_0058820 [Cryptomeria japonica]
MEEVRPHPELPPGFRFHPTDEELLIHYLRKKISSSPLPVSIIADVDLYKFDPWDLPGMARFGEQEWYFFSPRERKYPNGARPNRAAASGYWKATGTDKPVVISGTSHKVGVKKALVFYQGKPPKGIKTNWIMHEYRLTDTTGIGSPSPRRKGSLRLDDWVLCRIYKKVSHFPRGEGSEGEDSMADSLPSAGQHSQENIEPAPKFDSFSDLFQLEDPNFLGGYSDTSYANGTLPVAKDMASAKLNSLKRKLSLVMDDDDLTSPKRLNNINNSQNAFPASFSQPFNLQKANFGPSLTDLQQMYSFPFPENRSWNTQTGAPAWLP